MYRYIRNNKESIIFLPGKAYDTFEKRMVYKKEFEDDINKTPEEIEKENKLHQISHYERKNTSPKYRNLIITKFVVTGSMFLGFFIGLLYSREGIIWGKVMALCAATSVFMPIYYGYKLNEISATKKHVITRSLKGNNLSEDYELTKHMNKIPVNTVKRSDEIAIITKAAILNDRFNEISEQLAPSFAENVEKIKKQNVQSKTLKPNMFLN